MIKGLHMKHIIILFTLFITTFAFAQMPNQSRVYPVKDGLVRYEAEQDNLGLKAMAFDDQCKSKTTCAILKDSIPEGFGGLSFGSFDGGTEARATLYRYNIHYSTTGKIPFYLLATATPTNSEENKLGKLNNHLLGTDSGLINFKIADDFFTFNEEGGDGKGLCDFQNAQKNLGGGCYLNTQAGVKLIDYQDESGKSKYLAALYASTQISFDFAISKEANESIQRAGRLVGAFGLSGYYANTDKVSNLFPEFQSVDGMDVNKLEKLYASFDAGLTLTIDEEFSIEASFSKPLINDDRFDTVTKISLNWLQKN